VVAGRLNDVHENPLYRESLGDDRQNVRYRSLYSCRRLEGGSLVRVGYGVLSRREFLERHRVKPSAGDRRAVSAFRKLSRIVAAAAGDRIAS
jgi:hypothetical protein